MFLVFLTPKTKKGSPCTLFKYVNVWSSVEMTDVKLDLRRFICRTIRPTFRHDDQEWRHLNFIHFAGNESSLLSICQDSWWPGYAGQSDHTAEDTFVHTFPVNRALVCYIWRCVVWVNKPCFQCVRYLRPASSCRSCSLCEAAGVWSSRIPTWWLLPLQRWCRCLEKRHNRDIKVSRARVAAAGMDKKHAACDGFFNHIQWTMAH